MDQLGIDLYETFVSGAKFGMIVAILSLLAIELERVFK